MKNNKKRKKNITKNNFLYERKLIKILYIFKLFNKKMKGNEFWIQETKVINNVQELKWWGKKKEWCQLPGQRQPMEITHLKGVKESKYFVCYLHLSINVNFPPFSGHVFLVLWVRPLSFGFCFPTPVGPQFPTLWIMDYGLWISSQPDLEFLVLFWVGFTFM